MAPERERIIERLVELGLTRNESLAWLCLLEAEEPLGLTGYEVAARSGIPRSAVYGVLRKLAESGAAFATGDKPARYAAVPPRDFVAAMRRSSAGRLAALTESLQRLPKRDRPEPVWILSAYGEVLARVEDLIRGARHSVCLSVWGRELERLRPALEAVAPGVHGLLHCVDPVPEPLARFSCWVDPAQDPSKGGWSHRILCAVDGEEALIGGAEPGADNQAVVTRNAALVDVATNHIILDITLIARRTGLECAEAVAPLMRPHFG